MALSATEREWLVLYNSYGFQHPDTGWPVGVDLLEDADGGLVLDAETSDLGDGDESGRAEADALCARLTGQRFPDEGAVRRYLIGVCGVPRSEL